MRLVSFIALIALAVSCNEQKKDSETLSSNSEINSTESDKSYNSMSHLNSVTLYNLDGTECRSLTISSRVLEGIQKVEFFPNDLNDPKSGFYEVTLPGLCDGKFRINNPGDVVFGNMTYTFEAYQYDDNPGCGTRVGRWENEFSCKDFVFGKDDHWCNVIKTFTIPSNYDFKELSGEELIYASHNSSRMYTLKDEVEQAQDGNQACNF